MPNVIEWIKFVGESIGRKEVIQKFLTSDEIAEYKRLDEYVEEIERKRMEKLRKEVV